jgi:hypothetical protein
MSAKETNASSAENIEKLKVSRTRYGGWLTKSTELLLAIKGRISGQLSKLQTAHNNYIAILTDDDAINEAEDWMSKYFDSATKCLTDIDAKLHEYATLQTNPTILNGQQPALDDSLDQPVVPDASSSITPTDTCHSIDGWIDELIVGKETVLKSGSSSSMDLSDVVTRLEMERDLPKVELPVFDGSAIMWPRFIEQYYVQIHSRPTLNDTRRMDILQSHVKGEAKALIEGLGYSGRNYAMTLKELKFAFGHRVAVA